MATIIRLARTGQRPAATAVRIMTSGRVVSVVLCIQSGAAIRAPVVRRSVSELVSTDVAARKDAAT